MGFLVVLTPLAMFIHKVGFSGTVLVLRDVDTMEPPLLLLGEGESYHLFLCVAPLTSCCPPGVPSYMPSKSPSGALCRSHVWSTGQDQCAVIKRQLQLLLPGVVVFLDVGRLQPTKACRA